jgi:translation initiation factor IF-1
VDARKTAGARRIEGVVVELLPHALYRVELPNRRRILAHAGGASRRNFLRILAGDRVVVEIMPMDLTRGRIVRKGA